MRHPDQTDSKPRLRLGTKPSLVLQPCSWLLSNELLRGAARYLAMAAVVMTLWLAAGTVPSFADDAPQDGPRAVRLSYVEGRVRFLNGSEPEQAVANIPLPERSRIETSEDGRAELQFEDGSIARIAPNSTLSLNQLRRNSDGSLLTEIELVNGLGYFELKAAPHFVVRYGANLISSTNSATFRLNADAAPGEVAVTAGSVHIGNSGGYAADVQTNETLRFEASDSAKYALTQGIKPDSWDEWNADRDRVLEAEAAQKTEATANAPDAENPAWSDLDAYGDWYSVPGYGNVWSPYGMTAGWDPYGYGSWYPYGGGYMWISGYPWGYYPYLCGTWNYFDAYGWGWVPGGWGGCGYWGAGWSYLNVGYHPPHYVPPPRPIPSHAHPTAPIPVRRGTDPGVIHPRPIAGHGRAVLIAGNKVEPLPPIARPAPAASVPQVTAKPGAHVVDRNIYSGASPNSNTKPGSSAYVPGQGSDQRPATTMPRYRPEYHPLPLASSGASPTRSVDTQPVYVGPHSTLPPPSTPHYTPAPATPHYSPPAPAPAPHYSPPPSAPASAPHYSAPPASAPAGRGSGGKGR